MRETSLHASMAGLVLAATILLTGCASTTNPRINPTGEPSFDGLLPLTDTAMNKVWAAPDLDFREYTKFMPVSGGLHYRPVRRANRATRSSASEFPLTDAQKQRLETIVGEEFTRELSRVTSLQMVDTPGPDVLIVRGTLIDIVSRIPPEPTGRTDFLLDSVGQATLVIELIDSQSKTVILRGVDTRAASTPGYSFRSNRVTNASEARRLAAFWARQLARGLDELSGRPDLNDDVVN